jgi:hypothetical protein
MGLSFTIPAGPRQRSHTQVRVPRVSWPHFTVSGSRLPQPGGPGSRIYIPQERGGPVIPPGTGFLFRRLQRLAGLWWSNRPRLHTGFCLSNSTDCKRPTLSPIDLRHGPRTENTMRTPFSSNSSIIIEVCLLCNFTGIRYQGYLPHL